VRADRSSSLKEEPYDYVIYTQLSGTGGGSHAIMRMVSEVDVMWIADLMPRLKDKIDVSRLSKGQRPAAPREDSKH